MKELQELAFDPVRCRDELAEFGELLLNHEPLEENKHILPFFRDRPHLSAFIGSYHPNIITRDRIAFEFDLFGDFTCDLVLGDSGRNAYCFVEFEDAGPRSLFEPKKGKSTPEWSRRFDHGYSQVIDWFWKLSDLERTHDFAGRFGVGPIDYNGLLIVGRSASLGTREFQRFDWRRQKVVIDSRHINCFTLDELHESLVLRMDHYGPTS